MRRNYSNPILKAKAHLTYKHAVEAKCAECMGCDADYLEPDFRSSIKTALPIGAHSTPSGRMQRKARNKTQH